MAGRSRARYLAPIALAATIAGTYVIVHNGLSSKPTPAPAQPSGTFHARTRLSRKRYYVVKPGDSMTSIASKTGISLNTLEQLNPGVQPDALQTGQRLRLRR
jgi:LysM repeat protein